jgi:hypothetical protein
MSNALSENWQFTTMSIEDDDSRHGTGFLVGDTEPWGHDKPPKWSDPASRAYLVTARHVLGDNESVVAHTVGYKLRFNICGAGGLKTHEDLFEVCSSPRNFAVHQDPSIDVAVLDVTNLLARAGVGHFRFCPLTELANPVSLLAVACDAGDEAFVLGYPLNLKQGRSNLPLIRKGILATSPCRPLVEGTKQLRGFLVDGAILPGSSGSPVVAQSAHFHGGDLALTPSRPLLLGVVAQEWGRGELQRYHAGQLSNQGQAIDGYANLGFAHSASAIIETIVQLGHHQPTDFLKSDHDMNWAPQLGVPEWALEFSGSETDFDTAWRIMLRLYRDRLRAAGQAVNAEKYHDALEIMGPVQPGVRHLPGRHA